jgi:hypothetical protein
LEGAAPGDAGTFGRAADTGRFDDSTAGADAWSLLVFSPDAAPHVDRPRE